MLLAPASLIISLVEILLPDAKRFPSQADPANLSGSSDLRFCQFFEAKVETKPGSHVGDNEQNSLQERCRRVVVLER